MVVSVDVKHVFKHPIELVVQTHFTKYPSEREKHVLRIDVLEHKIDFLKGTDYRRRLAVCDNVLPRLLRKINALNEKTIVLEEETWLNTISGCLHIKSRNVTWEKYATMKEESHFFPHPENTNWTQFEQHGSIEVQGLGTMGRVLELFARQFLYAGVKRSLFIMEQELKDRCSQNEEVPS
ncbi:PRELI domain-containing protein 2-like [Littorina saxatilis]|uniref:PRELI/MSF1 domain-containing protein n=1 Tax=Littorina saxatilis TaxID=31220 RepID=A0AAN9BLB1_9CAEN